MAENVFTQYGGKVKFTPDRVKSTIDPVEFTDEDQIRNIALQRDLTAANLLENDILLDMLDAAIDDQMKEFALTAPDLYDAAMSLCGSPTVTWECYKKAKELLRIAPWIAYGYDPTQLIFTDKLQKRAGNVVFDCKQFDPDTFHNTGTDPMATVDSLTGTDDNDPNTETPSEIEKKARENQKKWALLILFWDLLWGKPVVKPGISDETSRQMSIDLVNEDIQKLKADGKNEEADALAKRLSNSKNLPNTIMLDRPRVTNQLQWSDKNEQPLESNFNPNLLNPKFLTKTEGVKEMKVSPDDLSESEYPWNEKSVAVWLDFASLTKAKDLYKDKSIPAIKSGFILSILEGFLGLPPKVCFFFIKGRFEFLRKIKWMKTNNTPIVKTIVRKFYTLLKLVIDLLTAVPVMINTIFLEICIWLALLPHHYMPNVSDTEPVSMSNTGLNQVMDVQPTPAGFISMDCFVAAQEIVNRVNAEAVN